MRPSPGTPTIGILGHYGTGNLGDEAIISAVIDNVRSRFPTALICGISSDPNDTRARHGIVAFAVSGGAGSSVTNAAQEAGTSEHAFFEMLKDRLRAVRALYGSLKALRAASRWPARVVHEAKFLMRSYRLVKGFDLLMVAGSGQLSDHFGGPWGMPYNLFKWSILARAAGTKLAFVSVGAGPLASSLSRFFIKRAVGLAHYRSFRDIGSRKVMERLGSPSNMLVMPDLAHSLPIGRNEPCSPGDACGAVVGINVFPHCDPRYWPVEDPARYARYVQKLAGVVAAVIDRGDRVVLLPTQVRADPQVIDDVERTLLQTGRPIGASRPAVASCISLEALTGQIAGCDFVVATRFHGVVMALLLNKPVIALSNHPKTTDLMADMGLSAYVLDIDAWDVTSLMERLQALRKGAEDVRGRIAARVRQHRTALARQYDAVLSLAARRRQGDVPLKRDTTPLIKQARWSRSA
jgi:polysaccharide pyruvyl transferase WcaK-like protein